MSSLRPISPSLRRLTRLLPRCARRSLVHQPLIDVSRQCSPSTVQRARLDELPRTGREGARPVLLHERLEAWHRVSHKLHDRLVLCKQPRTCRRIPANARPPHPSVNEEDWRGDNDIDYALARRDRVSHVCPFQPIQRHDQRVQVGELLDAFAVSVRGREAHFLRVRRSAGRLLMSSSRPTSSRLNARAAVAIASEYDEVKRPRPGLATTQTPLIAGLTA